jgi:hypothetical protein
MKNDLNCRTPQPATCNFQPATSQPQPGTRFSLQNRFGFWELTFDGQFAVVPQDQGLFYVAWLLSHPCAAPIHGYELASEVYDLFGEHQDFRPGLSRPGQHREEAQIARSLIRRQKVLEAILDSEDELDPVKAEALRELVLLQETQKACFAQFADTLETTARIVVNGLLDLHARLTAAVNTLGNPHPVGRAFAHHLLVHLLIPSNRASAQDHTTRFVYQPPGDVTWECCVGAG